MANKRTVGLLNILVGADNSQFTKKIGETEKRLKQTSRKLQNISQELSLKVSAPLALLGGLSVQTAAKFDDSMRKVKALSGAVGENFENLSNQAKQLGATTAFSASQASDAMGFLALAGFEVNEILGATPALLNLASASGTDLARTTDIVSDSMTAFGISADEANTIADQFAKTQAKSNTTVEMLGEAMKYAGAAASTANISLAETNAIIGFFSNAGIKSSMAGTTFAAMLRDLKGASKDGAIAVGNTSVALYDQEGRFRNILNILGEVEKATVNMTDAERDSALASIFKEQSIRGVNVLLSQGIGNLRDFTNEVINSEGAAKAMGDELEGGLGGSLRLLASSFESIKIEIGQQLTPVVSLFANVVNQIAQGFANLNPNVKTALTIIGGLLTVVPPLILGFSQFLKVGSLLITTSKALLPLLGGISAPILAIGAAVAAAAVIIYKNWDSIVDYFTKGAGGIFFNEVKETFNIALDGIKDLVNQFVDWIKPYWGTIKDVLLIPIKFAWNNILFIFDNVFAQLTDVVRLFKYLFQGNFKDFGKTLLRLIARPATFVFRLLINTINNALGYIDGLLEKVGFEGRFKEIINSTSSFLDEVDSKIDNFFKSNKTKDVGVNAVVKRNVTNQIDEDDDLNSSPIGRVKKSIEAVSSVVTKELDVIKGQTINLGKVATQTGIKLVEANTQYLKSIESVKLGLIQWIDLQYQAGSQWGLVGEGFLAVGNAMQQQLMNLYNTGKFSFEGMIKQIGVFIARLIAAIAAAAILSALVSTINPFGAASSGLKEAFTFGNLAKQFSGGLLNFDGYKANGGDVSMGNAYMIGEHGREMFVPEQNGTIVSNTDLSKMNGNQSIMLDGKFRIQGSDLVYIVNKENKKRSRV